MLISCECMNYAPKNSLVGDIINSDSNYILPRKNNFTAKKSHYVTSSDTGKQHCDIVMESFDFRY